MEYLIKISFLINEDTSDYSINSVERITETDTKGNTYIYDK